MKSFISKLETKNYFLGSFDAFEDASKELTIRNLSGEGSIEVDLDLYLGAKSFPYASRAAITDKNGNYVGYIGLYNFDEKNQAACIRFAFSDLSEEARNEILEEFRKFAAESLNYTKIKYITYISKNRVDVVPVDKVLTPKNEENANIIVPSRFLKEGVSADVKERFGNPSLENAYTIKYKDKVLGIIGLSNLMWSNRRANLCIYLDESLGSDILKVLPGYLIDDYVNYIHSLNVHNLMLSVNGSDDNMLNLLKQTNMNYFGSIPFGAITGDEIGSRHMLQHTPNMVKQGGLWVPDNRVIPISLLNTSKTELRDKIDLGNGCKMVNPNAFEKENIDLDTVVDGYVRAMQDRENFSKPAGEDKTFLQRGCKEKCYGLYKRLKNFKYVVLDDKNNFVGYTDIIRSAADGKNVDIEIGISPELQHRGIGTSVINTFYDELFSTGVASITSAVFEFNKPSLLLHDKVASINGVRIEAYYINGRLWDMSYFSKVNEICDKEAHIRHS